MRPPKPELCEKAKVNGEYLLLDLSGKANKAVVIGGASMHHSDAFWFRHIYIPNVFCKGYWMRLLLQLDTIHIGTADR